MMREEMSRLATEYLHTLKSKPSKVIASEEALKDVTPIDWDRDILDGKRTVTVGIDPGHRPEREDVVPWVAE